MNDKIILVITFILYSCTNRNTYFRFIYSGLLLSNLFHLINYRIYKKTKIKLTTFIFIKYILVYVTSYILIKDPNPFFHLLSFYLPCQNYFRGIFIIIFITYYNNKISYSDKQNKFFLSNFINYYKKNKIKLIFLLIILILIRIILYFYNIKFWINFSKKEKILSMINQNNNNTKYYICSVIYNMEPIIKDWIFELKKLMNYLGNDKMIISIIENGDSTDNTRFFLNEFQKYLNSNNIPNLIITDQIVEKNSIPDRIIFLSILRNASLNYLYNIPNLNFNTTKIIFLNDIIFRYEDIIKLLISNKGNFDSVCAMDFYESFYDTWASIGLDGKQFLHYYPYSNNKEQQDAYINGELVRVVSCWGGVMIVNSAKVFENKGVYFRFGKKLRQSECTLLNVDMYWKGYKKKFVNTQVAVSYNYEYYYKNHYLYPWTKNLFTYFYYYFRFGFHKRNYNLTNVVDNNITMDEDMDDILVAYVSE